MKYFIVLACLLAVSHGLAPEIMEKIKEKMIQMAGECKTEAGATDDDINTLKAQQAPSTQTGKCFLACMHKKMGFQDGDGKINKDAVYTKIEMMKTLDEDLYNKMKKVADICLGQVTDAADPCETALNMFTCIQREKQAADIPPFNFSQ